MEKQISNLKDHFIICGFGRVGMQIAEELYHEKVPFVVVDRDPEKIKKSIDKGWLGIIGDAAVGEDSLKKAQISRAKGLIIAIGEDADAVFVAVTAKSLRSDLFIIARASSTEVASKLEKVGVERVALPYQIGGYHMANMALRPEVVDFLDVVVDSKHREMVVEELNIGAGSKLDGAQVDNHFNRSKTGVVILAIKNPDKSCIINPTPDIILKQKDKLILLGTKEDVDQMRGIYGF
ncbi:MAG: NAD-binding protein [Candidatus Berkelbacteria bacterium]|nr:NAD-binding protein [Candidatus Berkelbacteria bacterium]